MTVWNHLERCLLPPPEIVRWNHGRITIVECTLTEKIQHYVNNFFSFFGYFLAAPFMLAYEWFHQVEVIQRPPAIGQRPQWPPEQRGFAMSLFQTSGLGTKWSATPGLRGRCDWDPWMDNPVHVLHPEGFDYRNFFMDVLSDPTVYIAMLVSQNVTAHRFSLEWSIIEPRRGEIDQRAVALYQNFINKLLEAGITPSVTLSHFVVPQWFHEAGSFQRMENIAVYVDFALKAMHTFTQVKDWWSFNELGVRGFQQAREVFPTDLPEGSSLAERVHAAGIATRNMLIAHCMLDRQVRQLHPDKEVGVTHQWLKIDTASGNWLEIFISSIFTKFAFTPVFQFFKEGRFSFEFPFMANIHFEIPREEFDANGHFLMRLGVQAYPMAMIKMGLNHGLTYPGHSSSITNLPFFSFGSTCEPGGTVMRFGPRWRPNAMKEILDEAFTLTNAIYITEFGSDANVHRWGRAGFEFNETAQAIYLQHLTERIRDYSTRTLRTIKGIFCWSDLTRQLEWDLGSEARLGVNHPVLDTNRRMTGWRQTPASRYLAQAYHSHIVSSYLMV